MSTVLQGEGQNSGSSVARGETEMTGRVMWLLKLPNQEGMALRFKT